LMRWYGPSDPVRLEHIAQAGCTGVVSALHAIPVGEVWSVSDITAHKSLIGSVHLTWTVVESLPVHEEIKTRTGDYRKWIDNYKQSLINLRQCGIKVVTYNFMPVLDWVRTDVAHVLPDGSEALFFHKDDFAALEIFMLRRPGVSEDYSTSEMQRLKLHFDAMDTAKRNEVFRNILLGLPGSDIAFTPEQVLAQLAKYDCIDKDQLKMHLIHFLEEVAPVAQQCDLKLAIHPDDPPYPVLGLPRILSTAQDIEDLMQAVPNPANGLCFCTGSFGARADNDLIEMLNKWGSRVYFLHLRNTKRDASGNFMEANHLEGDTDMYAVMKEVVALMQSDQRSIPMRPDHGHKMLDDLGKKTYPGYSGIGRLKGLAELRGLEYAILASLDNHSETGSA
jgi:mannonate dehydratase